ncbi:hypothetical protein Barb7_03051 [Bacteroidales bacterium Barb7]|nr:hypothetical protein Barb7_03051 [Bacteroidales bacterium Barb7]
MPSTGYAPRIPSNAALKALASYTEYGLPERITPFTPPALSKGNLL